MTAPILSPKCSDNQVTAGVAAVPAKPFTDPVCGMQVTDNPEKTVVHESIAYHFCCQGCATKFRADPQRYLSPRPPADEVPAGTTFTCPMHLDVLQVGPGTCPFCGMALEPLEASAEEDTTELDDMTRRLWISVALTLPLLLLTMGDQLPGAAWHQRLGMPLSLFNGLQALLATPVVLWAGWPFFERAWASFSSRHLNMFSLIGLGTGAAFSFSLVAWLIPGTLPAAFLMDGTAPLYFEAAAAITTLVLLGQVLELRARSRTGSAIRALLALTPDIALRVRADGTEEDIPTAQIAPGDKLRVKPGERIAVDGIVQSGTSTVDESMLSGEAMPVQKIIGSKIIAGTINQTGALVMSAQQVGADTLLAKIVGMVNTASRSRAPIQKVADVVAGWFVPIVMLIALLTFVVWALLGPAPVLTHAIVASVSVLIIACPCALGLATPMSIMVGIGRGAQQGVLIKDAEALERMERIDTLVIDKTGTLTEGRPRVQSVLAIDGITKHQLVGLAASLETHSEHPLAQCILEHAKSLQLTLAATENFSSQTGLGVSATIDGQRIAIGNATLMQQEGADIRAWQSQITQLQTQAHTVILIAIDGNFVGLISAADPIKKTAAAALRRLQESGVQIVLLSGDNTATALAVARQLDIVNVHAELMPEQKYRHVQQLQQQGRRVAMAGDGINDAPALAQADVGIAMGTGTDIAMQSAHIVLVTGDLNGIAQARQLSRATMRNIRQNLGFAFAYNLIGVPIAAGVLYPWFGLLLSPMIASAAMSASSVSVIGNALRLRKLK